MRLLIVDDSRMSRLILQGLVRQMHPDWDTLEAANGDEALDVLRRQPVDLVSMDYNMPGLNGVQAALRLRELAPGLPVVLMTANVQSAVQLQAQEHGLLFLPKPITAESVQRMSDWWRAHAQTGSRT